jgi:PAS domain S-box-containing protein
MGDEVQAYCTISYRTVYDRVLLHVMPAAELETVSLSDKLKAWFIDAMLKTSDTHVLFSGLLDIIADMTGLESGAVFVRDMVNDTLKIDASSGVDRILAEILHEEARSQWGTLGTVLFFGRQLEDVSIPPVLARHGIRTALLIPVAAQERLQVMYALFSQSRSRFAAEERRDIGSSVQVLKQITLHLLRVKNLESSETLYRSLIRSMPSGVIVRNLSGRIIHYNLVVARTFCQRNDTTLPPDVLFEGTRFFSEDDTLLSEEELPGMVSLRDGRRIRNCEIRVLRKDNTSVWLSVNTEPMFEPGEKSPFAMVATFKDITITRRIRKELEKTREEAVEANRSKSTFLANISHEIRTPLSGIMGMTDILLSRSDGGEHRRQLMLMKDAEETLLDIINKVLELSKIESGALTIEYRPFDLRNCIKKSVVPLQMNVKAREIEFLIEVEEEIPEILVGDGNRLQQILINLISNAIKFTERGKVRLSVRQYSEMEDNQLPLLFAVHDTGIGIPRAEQTRIFDIFQQVDSSFSKRHQGTGLGLSITKQLIELMGGTIWLESVPGRGSTFYFTLDLRLPVESEIKAASQPGQTVLRSAASLHILLVEDNLLNRESVVHFLSEMGHRSSVAENGEQALEMLRENEYDLVLMDVQMPKMNGMEATIRIRQGGDRRIRKDIPIIALTAYAMKNEVQQLLDAGMDACVSKPINRDHLFHSIEQLVNPASADRMNVEQPFEYLDQLQIEDELAEKVDFSPFVDDYRTDMEVARQLLTLFVRDVPGSITAIERSLEEKNGPDLADIFHSLTNNLSAVRLHMIGQLTREMEQQALAKNFNYIAGQMPGLKNDLSKAVSEAKRYLGIFKVVE